MPEVDVNYSFFSTRRVSWSATVPPTKEASWVRDMVGGSPIAWLWD